MSGHMRVDEATINAVASELRFGAEQLADGDGPPQPIEAGRVTGALAALGAELAKEARTLAGELGGAAEKVETAGATFAEVDEDAVRAMTPPETEVHAPPRPGKNAPGEVF